MNFKSPTDIRQSLFSKPENLTRQRSESPRDLENQQPSFNQNKKGSTTDLLLLNKQKSTEDNLFEFKDGNQTLVNLPVIQPHLANEPITTRALTRRAVEQSIRQNVQQSMNLSDKFNQFYWKGTADRAHIDVANWANNKYILAFRILALIELCFEVYLEFTIVDYHEWEYFTTWGLYLTTLYFTFALISSQSKFEPLEEKSSMWTLRKTTIMLFNASITFESLITLFYWTLLNADFDGDSFAVILSNHIDHSLPLTFLLIDFTYNCMPFDKRHLGFWVLMVFVYGMVNMSVEWFITHTPVYSDLNWDDLSGWALGLSLLPFEALDYLFFYYMTKLKLRLNNKTEYMQNQ